MPTCCIDACDKKVRSSGSPYCETHYYRLRRTGSTDKQSRVKPGLLEHTGGYLLAHLPGHPLQRSSKRVYEHRAVFYAQNGDGPFNCHVCRAPVDWDSMHVDHLNDDVQDNSPVNLAPACPTCNQHRGAPKVRQTMKAKGRLLTAHGKTMCLSDWARHLGLSRPGLARRIALGQELDSALTPDRARTGPARRREPIPDYVVDISKPQLSVT